MLTQWQDLPSGESMLARAGRCVPLAVSVVTKNVPRARLQQSFLANGRYMSSSCTGVATAEVALALINKAVNQATDLDMRMEPYSCHAL